MLHYSSHPQGPQIQTRAEIAGVESPLLTDQRSSSVPIQQTTPVSFGSNIQHSQPHNLLPQCILEEPENHPMTRRESYHDMARTHVDDPMYYPSPESVQSSPPDSHSFTYQSHTPTIESIPERFFDQSIGSSLRVTPSIPDWNPLMPLEQSSQMLSVPVEGDVLQTVGEPSYSVRGSGSSRRLIRSTLAVPRSVPFCNPDGDEWFALRCELDSAARVIPGNDGLETIDAVIWQNCLELYWKYFHPYFPIIHRPTYFVSKLTPLLAGSMVAIGSQFDTHPRAKEHSLALLEACLKLLDKVSFNLFGVICAGAA